MLQFENDIVVHGVLANAADSSSSFMTGIVFVWTLVFLLLTHSTNFKAFGVEINLKYRWIALSCYSVVNAFMVYKLILSLSYADRLPTETKGALFGKLTLGGPILFSGFSGLSNYYFKDLDPSALLVNSMIAGLMLLVMLEFHKSGWRNAYQGYAVVFLGIFNLSIGAVMMQRISNLAGS
jgi:hypothetical protein